MRNLSISYTLLETTVRDGHPRITILLIFAERNTRLKCSVFDTSEFAGFWRLGLVPSAFESQRDPKILLGSLACLNVSIRESNTF